MPKRATNSWGGWRDDFIRAFGAARFSDAGRTYDTAVEAGARPSFDDRMQRARIYLKRDENQAVAFLIAQRPDRETPERRGLWHIYLGVGYARMRDFERADHHFAKASETVVRREDLALLAYHVGRRMLLQGRVDEARRQADAMSCDPSLGSQIDRELLRSFAFGHEEKYFDEASALLRTLRIIGDKRESHLERWFHTVENLAALARELDHAEAASAAKNEVDLEVEWPADFALQRFQSLKAVGWTRALQGDALGCFRYLRMAERAAPSEAFKAIVLLDRAHFARYIGERNWSQDETAMAESTANGVDWNATDGDERVGLLLLAETFADIDAEKARYYLARYSGLEKIRSPLHLFAFDHRLDAMAAYAKGVVELEAGDARAEESLRRALAVFDEVRYQWRAGRAALALHRATGGERWLHVAEAKLKPYSKSWLGEELRLAKMGKTYRVQLPKMQRRVFDMLCRKLTTSGIADQLGLSQHTVRNHLKAVFRAYGVSNRSALIAEAARRGELPLPFPIDALDGTHSKPSPRRRKRLEA